jgi:hypothetical protein
MADTKRDPRVEPKHHRLPDGTSWPTASRAAELDWILRYSTPTRSDLLEAASVLTAYHHVATHPAGTERVIRQVRMLRRAETSALHTAPEESPNGER